MKRRFLSFALFLLTTAAFAQNRIDLSGTWQFKIDRDGTATATSKYDDSVELPGSMLTRGKGDVVSLKTRWVSSLYDSSYFFNPYMKKYQVEGNMKFPFFLTPDKHYVGNAWYRRTVSVPLTWKKQRVILTLERPHIETTVFVNNKEVGHQMSLSAPHVFDITNFVVPGKDNEIAIKIYNGIENVCVGQDSHSVTDQTQGCWNGIVGRMSLDAHPMAYISNVAVFPDVENKLIDVKVKGTAKKFKFEIDGKAVKSKKLTDSTYQIVLGDEMRLWDEYNPNVYKLAVISGADRFETVFGMRSVKVDGTRILLNGKQIYVRGTVGNCCFPETGYPPTDEASWTAIFKKCKEYGLNTMRFHSYCPPEAAFTAADKLGFYLQPEGPSWPNHGVKLYNKQYIDIYLMDDTKRLVEAYGNHPSFVMLSAGNEPAGGWVKWCNEWVAYWKKTDSRRIYCGANVGGGWAWDDGSEYHVKGGGRGLDWSKRKPHSDDDYLKDIQFPRNYKGKEPNNSPMISHEQGQWCAFPDLKERSQYTGAYKAKNFDIFEDLLRDHGMGDQAEKVLYASGKLQVLAYKYEMERNFRTKDYAGFVLLGLNDYSGQGTALVGPLNVHWKEKGYVDADEWTNFCNDVVPLARFAKFVYKSDEKISVPIEIYNATGGDLTDAKVEYNIRYNSKDVDGELLSATIPAGKNNEAGTVAFDPSSISTDELSRGVKCTLSVSVKANGKSWLNNWEFWVYPKTIEMPDAKNIYISDTLDSKALDVLKKGGKVLLTAAGKVRYGNDIRQDFLPVFWNTSWFKMRPPHTTGAYIDTTHPIYNNFVTDRWTNINWWELSNRAQVMNLSEFPIDYQPPMQPIDTWHVSRKCGTIVEANVLNGKLLMTTLDITKKLDERVVARQLRKSIIEYMNSREFDPSIRVEPSVITNLYEKTAPPVNMFTKDSPDELKPKIK